MVLMLDARLSIIVRFAVVTWDILVMLLSDVSKFQVSKLLSILAITFKQFFKSIRIIFNCNKNFAILFFFSYSN